MATLFNLHAPVPGSAPLKTEARPSGRFSCSSSPRLPNSAPEAARCRFPIFGGLTAGIVALPLALAFGVQSGLGAAYGLYGAIFLGFFAALLGGTPAQISGPTGPMTVVTAALLAELFADGSTFADKQGTIVLVFVLAGVLQVVMGFLKIGSLIRFIPYPVVSGFMSGIGVIIILLQIFPAVFGMFGLSQTEHRQVNY